MTTRYTTPYLFLIVFDCHLIKLTWNDNYWDKGYTNKLKLNYRLSAFFKITSFVCNRRNKTHKLVQKHLRVNIFSFLCELPFNIIQKKLNHARKYTIDLLWCAIVCHEYSYTLFLFTMWQITHCDTITHIFFASALCVRDLGSVYTWYYHPSLVIQLQMVNRDTKLFTPGTNMHLKSDQLPQFWNWRVSDFMTL